MVVENLEHRNGLRKLDENARHEREIVGDRSVKSKVQLFPRWKSGDSTTVKNFLDSIVVAAAAAAVVVAVAAELETRN